MFLQPQEKDLKPQDSVAKTHHPMGLCRTVCSSSTELLYIGPKPICLSANRDQFSRSNDQITGVLMFEYTEFERENNRHYDRSNRNFN